MARNLFALGALLLVTAACAPVSVSVDFDPEEDFTQFQTFSWVPMRQQKTGDYRLDSPLLDKRIREAVEMQLMARGYTQVEDRLPDFYVAYHLAVEDKLDVYTVNRYYGDFYWTYSIPETRVHQYEQGTLVIDIADARENELVWRGIGVGVVRQHSTPEQSTEDVNAAVGEILKRFPPGAES